MNTSRAPQLAPLATAPARHHDVHMTRILVGAAVALALPLLAACSGGGSPTPSADAVATSPAEPDATSTLDIEGGDPFCDLAVDQLPNATAIEAKAGEIQAMIPELITGGSVDGLNQWGDDMSALVGDAVAFYDEAIPMVDDPAAQASFVKMRAFVNDYSLELAAIAQTSTSGADFVAEMSAFIQQPEINAAMTEGPVAAGEVRAYIDERCGTLA